MSGCEHCTVRIDTGDWTTLEGDVLQLRSAVESGDVAWSNGVITRIEHIVSRVALSHDRPDAPE